MGHADVGDSCLVVMTREELSEFMYDQQHGGRTPAPHDTNKHFVIRIWIHSLFDLTQHKENGLVEVNFGSTKDSMVHKQQADE
jgi:hypothetical protein